MEKLMTRTEVADFLAVSIPTVDRISHQGRLPRLKIGNATRYCRDDLIEYIKKAMDNGDDGKARE